MTIGRSKTGKPTITENGGGMTNTGSATIVCDADGQKLKPLFIPRGYSNGEHAIFVIEPGQTCFVNAGRSHQGDYATVYRIIKIKEPSFETEILGKYENGDGDIPSKFQAAFTAALEKTKCYHCREPHYIK